MAFFQHFFQFVARLEHLIREWGLNEEVETSKKVTYADNQAGGRENTIDNFLSMRYIL